MALDQSHRTFGKVTKVFATKLKSFTFVPALKKLPIKNRVASNYKTALQTSRPNKTLGEPEDSEGSKMDEGIYKAEVVYIQDPEEDKPGETFTNSTQSEIQPTNLAPNPPATLTGPYKEFGSLHRKTSPATMETIDTKQACVSHLGFHNTSAGAEVSSGLCLNSMSQREDVLSPASSLGFLTSPASSKESILSEGWVKERSWSALYMLSPDGSPVPFSRTVSPCSSVRSGTFTPSVVRIKRHTLAPGSSLVQMSPTCGTPCCDSRGTSPCPLSPRSRHRPPPTQLSLLTAILRKGRLPVLSSAFQRPYTPCWPISPVNMSSCLACSAASAVAPMDVSKAKSCTSINRSCSESCHNSKPLKPVIYSQSISSPAQEPDKSVATPLKTPDKLDYHRYVTNSSGILPVKCSPLTSQSLPTVPAHLSKSGHKDTHFSGVPSLLSNTSFSRLRSMSPKSNSPTCRSPDSQKAPPVSSDYTVFKDQNDANGLDNYLPSSILKNKHITHDLSEKLSSGVRQRSELSPEPSLKQSASDYSTSSASKPAQNSHKCSSSIAMNLPAVSRDNASPVLNNTESKQGILLQNGKKISSDLERVRLSSPAFSLSPSPRPVGLTRLSYTPPVSPACVSNYPNSRSSTPDRCTLSPSPGVPSRQLSPSPAYSYCSSPSSSMWGSTSDCTDRDSKNRKLYKIKSTYKALAAIPTNTLLMEQQAIDDEVNKKEALLNPADNYAWEDPHSEMCSPAQLRQQSAELYATIDEVLEDSIQRPQSHHVNKPTVKSLATEAPRSLTSSPSPRLLGRETKYANSYLQPPVPTEKTLTKPGVIRPVIVTSRLHDDKEDEKFHPNPFTIHQDNTSSRYHYKFISGTLCDETEADGGGVSVKQSASRERLLSDGRGNSSKTSLASLITQTRGSPQNVPTSIITSHTEPQETHI